MALPTIKRWVKAIYWAVYAQTPRGRYERRVLTNPDVQAAFEESFEEIERLSRACDEEAR